MNLLSKIAKPIESIFQKMEYSPARRQYIRSSAVGVGLLICAATIVEVGAQDIARFGFTRYLMGTQVKILLYAADSTEAAGAAGQAFDHIDKLNEQLSEVRNE